MSFTISGITWRRIDLDMTEPFAIAGGTHEMASIVVVSLTLASGEVGLGEAAPLPAYNGETVDDVERALVAARDALVSTTHEDWHAVSDLVASVAEQSGAARCALEMALVDALARHAQQPLYRWFGGGAPPVMESDVTVPIGSPAAAGAAARKWWEQGFTLLKVKVGQAATDLQRVAAVHAAAPEARISIDGNAGLTARQAVQLWEQLVQNQIPVELFEQPVPRGDWPGLREVAGAGARLALDESVVTAQDAERVVQELGVSHVLNIKLMKAGIREAFAVAQVAQRDGVGLMIGGMVESPLAMTVSACFAAAVGGFEYFDLDTPLFLSACPLVGGYELVGPRVKLANVYAGHGVHWAAMPSG